ncbi:MAG: enoyl-CoA hydratase/isomerase family protein [Actinobacteria bacterium]|nr:enoyl-CoA hydratase/isomerase family protein [Actinomycetota bacterium]
MAKVEVERDGAVWVLTLNRPEVHNAVDGETADLITGAVEGFAEDREAGVMVVTGAGGNFCSGADLGAAGELIGRPDAARTGPMGFSKLDPGKPTIAAVEGSCYAGGLELAAWCDLRVAGAGARFGCLSRRWGVPYVDGGSQRFPRIVGQGNALYLLITGVRIDAGRAYDMGLVQEVVPAGGALDRALELARGISGYPQASLRADRAAALAAPGTPLPEGLDLEAATSLPTLADPELLEGLRRFAEGDRPEPPTSPGRP